MLFVTAAWTRVFHWVELTTSALSIKFCGRVSAREEGQLSRSGWSGLVVQGTCLDVELHPVVLVVALGVARKPCLGAVKVDG